MKTRIQPQLHREFEASSGFLRLCFRKQIKYTENETVDDGYCAGEHMGREGGGTELSWPRQEVMHKLKELATSVNPGGKERGWETAFGRRQGPRNYYSAPNHRKMALPGAASSVLRGSGE